MGDIRDQKRVDLAGDFRKCGKVDDARHRGAARPGKQDLLACLPDLSVAPPAHILGQVAGILQNDRHQLVALRSECRLLIPLAFFGGDDERA